MCFLSAALIVKNEAARLSACIASLRDTIDEIVIVDTGSTDGTMAIASQHTDTLYRSQYFNADTSVADFDFAKARNEALAYCHGDWVLSIDADERLHNGKLREYLQEYGGERYQLYGKNTDGAYVPMPRIFRRRDNYHWRFRIHEMIQDQNAGGFWTDAPTLPLDVASLIHTNDLAQRPDSIERNMVLLQQQYDEAHATHDARMLAKTHAELGDCYRLRKQWAEALGHYVVVDEAITIGHKEFRIHVLCAAIECYLKMRLPRQAQQCAKTLTELVPDSRSAWALLGRICQSRGEYHNAIEVYKQALNCVVPEVPDWRIQMDVSDSSLRSYLERSQEKINEFIA
jgi:glycosyltransferase involved in cell wall biosynthesis